MQKKKTGKLFGFCLQAIAIIAKKSKKKKNFFGKLGEDIGLLFQITDDFLDFRGSKKLVGKLTKKDKKKGKSTLINLIGHQKSFKYAVNLKKKYCLN